MTRPPPRAPASPYRPDRKKRSRHFYNAVGLVAFVVMAFPVYWLIVSSLRTTARSAPTTRSSGRPP
ncbi:hypothetical protein SFUMM280S_00776 [Streptomyces fumanus]